MQHLHRLRRRDAARAGCAVRAAPAAYAGRSGRPAPAAGLLLLAALAVLPPLAGCSPAPPEQPMPGDIGSAPREHVREGGALRWAVDAMPSTLNVYQADAGEGTARVTGAVLPSLFTTDVEGTPRRNPDYLRSARITGTEPRQVVVYRINPKARWSDGKPVTAGDFRAQWKALNGADTAFWAARADGYREIADVVPGGDAREVKVTFKATYADWRMLFTPLYPKSVTGSPGAFNDTSRLRLPATAGPFRIGAIDRRGDDRSVTLVRDRRWWGEQAKLDRIVLRPVPPAEREAAVRRGRLDVAELRTGPHRPRPIPGVRLRKGVAASFTQLTLNGSRGPLADERVRLAVARAVDRGQLAEIALRPLGLPVRTLGNHLVMAHQPGYRDNSPALGGPDPQSAESLLAEAGWRPGGGGGAQDAGREEDEGGEQKVVVSPSPPAFPSSPYSPPGTPGPVSAPGPVSVPSAAADGRGLRPEVRIITAAAPAVRGGRALTLRLLLPARSATLDAVAGRVAAMLAEVGVGTEVRAVGDDSFFLDHVASGEFDLALFSWPGTPFPATQNRPVYAKPVPAPDGSLTVGQNYAGVGTDEIDQLFARASRELDAPAARNITHEADARIWAAAHSLPLYQPPQVVAVRASVANVGAFGFRTPRYQDIGFTGRPGS